MIWVQFDPWDELEQSKTWRSIVLNLYIIDNEATNSHYTYFVFNCLTVLNSSHCQAQAGLTPRRMLGLP